MSETRYFHAENSNRFIRSQGHVFAFVPYEIRCGCWHGVWKTDRVGEQSALAELVKDIKSAVTEIDAAEYQRCLQKKAHNDQRSGLLNLPQPPSPTASLLSDALAVGSPVKSELPPPDETGVVPLPSASDALNVGNVTATQAVTVEKRPSNGVDLT